MCVNDIVILLKLSENILIQVSAVSPSFGVTMAGVFPPPQDVMGLGHAPMEVMRGTVVSDHATSCNWIAHCNYWHFLLQFVQFPVEVEHFDAGIVSAFGLLAAVIGYEIALMAVMRLDVQAQLPVSLCWEMFPSVWENLKCLHAMDYCM